jgi:hypothetical protein
MASFSVVSNIGAANAQANLGATSIGLQRTIGRLSSGFRINQSGDDAAGLAVANAYRSTQAVLISITLTFRPVLTRKPLILTLCCPTGSPKFSISRMTGRGWSLERAALTRPVQKRAWLLCWI